MGEVTSYPDGTFCWIDLGTPDVAGAKAFYGDLLGWESEDLPTGQGGTFTMCRLRGKAVAAIHQQDGRASWSSFISVDDVDATTERAEELGATALEPPFDVMDAGRMALLRDPVGATVALWEPEERRGAELVNDVGAWGWNELVTPDVDEAIDFYGRLFGWTAEEQPAPMRRAGFAMGDLLIGGIHEPAPVEAADPAWGISFSVSDADQAAARAQSLGGTVVLPPMDIPIGRFTVVADPAGATCTLAAVPTGPLRGVDGS
jgi:predicted enzyme related to lactoylglutathione lyase